MVLLRFILLSGITKWVSNNVEGVKIDRMRVPFVFICENNSKAPYEFVDIDSEIPIMKHRQIEQ